MSATKRRTDSDSWPALLVLVVLGLFWCFCGLVVAADVLRWVGAGPEFRVVLLAQLEWTMLYTGIGIAHLLAAFGLRAGRGWATVLGGVLGVLGLLVFGSAARSLIMLTVDAEGYFDIDAVQYWRFHGWQVIGIFGLLLLADAVILVAVARSRWRSTNTETA